MIKKPRKRGGYSPERGLQNTNPQWVVVPVEKKPVELLWTSDQLVAEAATYTTHNKHEVYLHELYGLICHKI